MTIEFVRMLMDLQKKGTQIFLTEEGYSTFLKIIQQEVESEQISELKGKVV
ncbi:hypothetical protein [Chengkuizengella marina]|uniref:hypothetical protein n=1 Tax=Chengkuizengella marina TaxID=2507566 RepID=UPI00136BDC30|nr:hypothetical protein [Chengkuizengella marina]